MSTMIAQPSTPGLETWLWAFAYSLGLAFLVCTAAASIRRTRASARSILKWGSALALLVSATRLGTQLEALAAGGPPIALAVLRHGALIVSGGMASWLMLSAIAQRQIRSTCRTLAWLLMNGAWLVVLSSDHLQRLIAPPLFHEALYSQLDIRSEDLREVRDEVFETDRGSIITAFHLVDSRKEELRSLPQSGPESMDRLFPDGAITQSAPSPESNCHGSVFMAGRYIVNGIAVEVILRDNRYHRVEVPRAGDLIVYRAHDGRLTHTGIVKLVDADLVLIESKWGLWRRYLHRPEKQPYSQNYAYYRSPRQGHELRSAARPLARQRETPQADRKKPIQFSCVIDSISASL